jgi:hypothetical protein
MNQKAGHPLIETLSLAIPPKRRSLFQSWRVFGDVDPLKKIGHNSHRKPQKNRRRQKKSTILARPPFFFDRIKRSQL